MRRAGEPPVPPDPTLEALMAGGHFAIAADRYEEQTGDAELAALMRIDGLEWELVDGVPALRIQADRRAYIQNHHQWYLQCGRYDFGNVYSFTGPQPIVQTPIVRILSKAGYGTRLIDRFHQLYCEAVTRVCKWD